MLIIQMTLKGYLKPSKRSSHCRVSRDADIPRLSLLSRFCTRMNAYAPNGREEGKTCAQACVGHRDGMLPRCGQGNLGTHLGDLSEGTISWPVWCPTRSLHLEFWGDIYARGVY
jgi:hypothetical protein